jgi:hypothetical protein
MAAQKTRHVIPLKALVSALRSLSRQQHNSDDRAVLALPRALRRLRAWLRPLDAPGGPIADLPAPPPRQAQQIVVLRHRRHCG